MRTVNLSTFIKTLDCKRCGNKVLYDDTPYHLINDPKDLAFEIACPKCGDRRIYTQQLKMIN